MIRRAILAAFVIAVLHFGIARPAYALPTSDPVDCWIENLTPSVQLGSWADYIVHMSGGLGTFSVSLGYGDGQGDQGTFASPTAQFNHMFATTGGFAQSALVSGAGSQATCSATTNVYP